MKQEQERDVLPGLWGLIPKRMKICFLTGMISGILIHAYMFTNKLSNSDDLKYLGGYGVGKEFGRWFLHIVNPWDGNYSAPWLTGLFAVFFLSLASCLVLSILKIESVTGSILVPLMMMSFPSVCSMFTYMFTADCYAVGIFLAVCAAWLIRKYRYGFLPGIALLVLSLGLYQSYLCLALGLLVIALFMDSLREAEQGEGKKAVWRIIRQGIMTLVILLCSVLLYTLVTRLINPDLSEYNGISALGSFDLSRLPRLILRAYRYVAEYFILKPYSFVTDFAYVLNILVCLFAVAFVMVPFFRRKIYKRPLLAVLYLFLAACIPLAMGSIIIMAPDATVTMLMLYQYVIVYLFVIAMMERIPVLKASPLPSPAPGEETSPLPSPAPGEETSSLPSPAPDEETEPAAGTGKDTACRRYFHADRLIAFGITAVLLLVTYENTVVTNLAYFRMGITYERVYAYYNRMVARIEATEGYESGDTFVLLGEYGLSETPDFLGDYPVAWTEDYYEDLSGVALEYSLLNSGSRYDFIRDYIGVSNTSVSDEEIALIKESEEYQAMPVYPADGCVSRINGVWVLKVCEETVE